MASSTPGPAGDLSKALALKGIYESIPLLNEDNYSIWRSKFQNLFRLRKILFIMNQEDETEELDEDLNQEITAYLLSRLEAATHSNIITSDNKNNARGIWIAAKTHFASYQSANQARVFNNFLYLSFNEQQIEKFVTTVRIHLNKLSEVGIKLPSDILAYLVLFKFPSSLKTMQSQIMHGSQVITVDYVLNHLIQHKNKVRATKEESKTDLSLVNISYPRCTNGIHNKRVKNHKREQCWAEFPHLRPVNQKGKKVEKKEDNLAQFFTFFCGANTVSSLNKSSFILDSGCSVHLLNSRQHFSQLTTLDGSEHIKTGKPGAGLKILGRGTAFLKFGEINLKLTDAYYVPEATLNLLSFGKFLQDNCQISGDNSTRFP